MPGKNHLIEINSTGEIESLNNLLETKIKLVSKIVLSIAIVGLLTYALFELFWGEFSVFIVGIGTVITLFLPFCLIFLNRVRLGMLFFIIIMSVAMLLTQFFYLKNIDIIGLMMIDFSVFFGLVICAAFILISNKKAFIIILLLTIVDGLCIMIFAVKVPLVSKRFFMIELFIISAIGFLVYYFSYLYNVFINWALLENKKQLMANRELQQVNRLFGRFVPFEFIKMLEKQGLEQVKPGDQIQKNMTIMFADIRAFTSLSEKMTPKQTFDFLNTVLRLICPTIRNYKGFIDKFIGDAILSIFPRQADDAVISAIESQKLLCLFNQNREKKGLPRIKVGFGINTGEVIVGIIGEQERMEETVISDAVNIASRLEKLTKQYGSSIIISESCLKQLSKPDRFRYRFLDQIQVTGKIFPLSIYEVLEGDDEKVFQKKYQLKDDYQAGWQFFCEGNIDEAVKKFNYILKKNPQDEAAAYLFKRCSDYID